MERYDSTIDANAHIRKLQYIFNRVIIPELMIRAELHDKSKLEAPEKDTYDKFIPMLQKVKYGTNEYNKIKEEMAKTGLSHHFEVNRHHPEHFKNGIKDMTLIDLVEMFIDWYSASLRSDTPFDSGLKMNIEKYCISKELECIFNNTYNEYLKARTKEFKKI